MDLFRNAETPSVNLSYDSDCMDNNLFAEEQPAPGSSSSGQESKKILFDNDSIKIDETSVQEKTLNDSGFNAKDTEKWNHKQPQKPKLTMLLRTMIEKTIMPNVTISIGDKSFKCHMIVLQCYSTFFKKFTNEVVIQLPEEKVTPRAFAMIYSWMLSEKPLVMPDGIAELFSAARFLEIEELVRQCWYCFGDIDCYREDTAFLMFLEATKAGHKDLEQLMLMRVSKFFLTVVASRDFLDLTETELCSLLSSNAIAVNSEIEVLLSAVRWLTHNWENRKKFLVDIAKCVRFNLMPSWYLVTLTKEAVSPEVLNVVKHPEVDQMINDGLSFVTSQMFYAKSQFEFNQFLKDMQLTPSPQRTWICDKHCEYHHSSIGQKIASVTYESFNDYLERIRNLGADHWRQVELVKGVSDSVSNSWT